MSWKIILRRQILALAQQCVCGVVVSHGNESGSVYEFFRIHTLTQKQMITDAYVTHEPQPDDLPNSLANCDSGLVELWISDGLLIGYFPTFVSSFENLLACDFFGYLPFDVM